MKELLRDKRIQHLIVSIVVLIGGGTLLACNPDLKSEVFGAIMLMLDWWFQRQSNGNGQTG